MSEKLSAAAFHPDHDNLSGEQNDPRQVFTLTEKIGEGSYGSVWRVTHNKTGKKYAIKRVGIDNDLEDLLLEIMFMKSCISENIVRYFGSYVCGQELWIDMEFCAGGSVSDLMRVTQQTLNERQIISVVRDMLKGLQFLHSKHKIHRDVKSGNVLLNSHGQGKLADFGVSGQLSDTMAKRHTAIGTPFWMAPEVIQEVGYDYKADIWSLGITVIEMAEGRPPHSEMHPMRVIFIIPSRPPPTMTEPEKWSPELNDFVKKCLMRDPNERPDATTLLAHPFLKTVAKKNPLKPLLKKQKEIIAKVGREKAYGLYQTQDTKQEEEAKGKAKAEAPAKKQPAIEDDDDENGIDDGTMVVKNDDDDADGFDDGTIVVKDDDDTDGFDDGTIVVKNDDDDDDECDNGTMVVKKDADEDQPKPRKAKEPSKPNPYKAWSDRDLLLALQKLEKERSEEKGRLYEEHKKYKEQIDAVIAQRLKGSK